MSTADNSSPPGKPAALETLDLSSVPQVPVRVMSADHQLNQAIEDASLLLAFSVQGQKTVDKEVTTALLQSIEALLAAGARRERPAAALQSDFWQAYDALATALAPVSAFTVRETIRLRTTDGWRHNPPRWMATIALLVFVISMALQFVWVAGKELEDNTATLRKQQIAADLRVWKSRDDQDEIGAELDPDSTLLFAPGMNLNNGRLSSNPPLDPRLRLAVADKWRLANRAEQTALREQAQLIASLSRQQGFMEQWYGLCPPVICSKPDNQATIRQLTQELKEAEAAANSNGRGSPFAPVDSTTAAGKSAISVEEQRRNYLSWNAVQTKLRTAQQKLETAQQEHALAIEQNGHMLLSALGTYAIPMLLGWLGAVTFMLRRLVKQLNEATYAPISLSLGLVRMCLGMIVGVLGGLVVPSASTNLPPMVLPFVFGYGIEIVFAGMDRIVRAFTENKDGSGSSQQQ